MYTYDRPPVKMAAAEMQLPDGLNDAIELAKHIRDGGDGEMYGADLVRVLGIFDIKELGTIRVDGLWGVDVIFFKNEDGGIGYDSLYSAQIVPADKVRRIVAHAYSLDSRYVSMEMEESFPRLKTVLAELRG